MVKLTCPRSISCHTRHLLGIEPNWLRNLYLTNLTILYSLFYRRIITRQIKIKVEEEKGTISMDIDNTPQQQQQQNHDNEERPPIVSVTHISVCSLFNALFLFNALSN